MAADQPMAVLTLEDSLKMGFELRDRFKNWAEIMVWLTETEAGRKVWNLIAKRSYTEARQILSTDDTPLTWVPSL